MKKLINKPEMVVYEMLQGFVAANKDTLRLVPEKKIILRKDCPIKGKVALLSGSGSGHEPDQVWFVGKGMLDAACPGEVFAAPTMEMQSMKPPRWSLLIRECSTWLRISVETE